MNLNQFIFFKLVLLILFIVPVQCKYDDRRFPSRTSSRDDRNRFKFVTVYDDDHEEDSENDGEDTSFEPRPDRTPMIRREPADYDLPPLSSPLQGLKLPSEAEVLLLDPRKLLTKMAKINEKSKPRENSGSSSIYQKKISNYKNRKEDYDDYDLPYDSYEDDDYQEPKGGPRGRVAIPSLLWPNADMTYSKRTRPDERFSPLESNIIRAAKESSSSSLAKNSQDDFQANGDPKARYGCPYSDH